MKSIRMLNYLCTRHIGRSCNDASQCFRLGIKKNGDCEKYTIAGKFCSLYFLVMRLLGSVHDGLNVGNHFHTSYISVRIFILKYCRHVFRQGK